jgi:hypothetical protein
MRRKLRLHDVDSSFHPSTFRGKLLSQVEAIIHDSKSGNQLFRSLRASIRCLCLPLLVLSFRAAAHDIPNDVTAQIFVKPDGEHLNVMVRVPLKSIRDVIFPERGPGYLDIDRTQPLLKDAAILWISDFLELYEGGPLPKRRASARGARIGRSFASYEAVAITGPRWRATRRGRNQALWMLVRYPIRSERSDSQCTRRSRGSAFGGHGRSAPAGRRVRAFSSRATRG